MTQLLSFSGSTRSDSYNFKLSQQLTRYAEQANAELTLINLKDYALPLYDGDLEANEGLPENAARLKKLMSDSDGYIITCPEYNGFMTPMLINTLDWCSRSNDAGVDLSPFSEKAVFVASASPGPGGGGRAATHLKSMLSGMGAFIFPQSLTVSAAFNAFEENGDFVDKAMEERAQKMMAKFIEFCQHFE